MFRCTLAIALCALLALPTMAAAALATAEEAAEPAARSTTFAPT